MNHLGLDVHSKATVWCLLDPAGEILRQGKTETAQQSLTELFQQTRTFGVFRCAQEIGGQSTFVYDVACASKVELLSFNAQQLRMIAASRKKTDRRDAYWIAKAVHSGMHPHPVFIPTDKQRLLRILLAERGALIRELTRWTNRAKAQVRASGLSVPAKYKLPARMIEWLEEHGHPVSDGLRASLLRCGAHRERLLSDILIINGEIDATCQTLPEVLRLRTIPGIGQVASAQIYASVGDVKRFPSARRLTAYAGLVPSVHQSGESNRTGGITRQGSNALRSVLVQCAHVLMSRCTRDPSLPLRMIGLRIQRTHKYKVTIVAMARHLLRIAFYVLRDAQPYNPARLRSAATEVSTTH